MHRTKQGKRGFTLIELMVTVAIIGILAAIGYPAYTNYVTKSNRSAVQSHMLELAQAQSQYLADTRTYAGSVADLKVTTPPAVAAKYDISIEALEGPPASFKITAKPKTGTSQAGDGDLTIDSSGARLPAAKWQ